MDLSVIIPTRDRADSLRRTLESLCSQSLSHHHFETLVIDNGSSDHTPAVCHSFRPRLPHFLLLRDPSPGLHVGRHLGALRAQAPLLVFADDDIVASPLWLESILRAFADPQIALVGGKCLPLFAAPVPDWIQRLWLPQPNGQRLCGYLSLLDLGDLPRPISPHLVFGCNFSIRKSLLLEAGGFHPDAMPQHLIRFRGDGETHLSDFLAQRRLPAFYHPGASVQHLVPAQRLTLSYFRQRAFNQGISNSFAQLRLRAAPDRPLTRASHLLRLAARLLPLLRAPGPLAQLALASHRGYSFHQRQFRLDPALREWVSRPNYLGPAGCLPALP